ncbi:hypothetical protein BD779DRAFT_1465909 [Infundibulicybe gibba]|nr:hypothetical protein BD779DRAFT_1465909 [Infundibulicybe gibba]
MVEPFAAVVANSILSSRSTLRSSSSGISLGRAMKASSQYPLAPDFFTPVPRDLKGKAKAANATGDDSIDNLFQCQEWSSCTLLRSIWCPKRNHFLAMQEINPCKDGTREKYRAGASRASQYQPFAPSMNRHQKRHVSHASELKEPQTSNSFISLKSLDHPSSASEPAVNRSSLLRDRFTYLLHLPEAQFELGPAWSAYTGFLGTPEAENLDQGDMLTFVEKLITAAERFYESNADLAVMNDWGLRIIGLLEPLEDVLLPYSILDFRRRCLLARAMALANELDEAILLIYSAAKIPLATQGKAGILGAYKAVMLSTHRHHGGNDAIQFLVQEWKFVGPYIYNKDRWSIQAQQGRSIRESCHKIITQIKHPAFILMEKSKANDIYNQQVGSVLLTVLCDQGLVANALDVYQEMQRQSLYISTARKLLLVRGLAQEGSFREANSIFHSITKHTSFKLYLSTGLHLYAHQGDDIAAEKCYNELTAKRWVSAYDRAMLIYAFAIQGRVEQALALFNDFFPESQIGKRQNSPDILHYAVVAFAYAQRGDLAGINDWLAVMSGDGVAPDIYVYTIILKLFAMHGDMDSIAAVLTQMHDVGIPPNHVSYTTIITLLAHRKDPVGAEAIYERAVREGIRPDVRMINSIMNAHVEAGSWAGAIHVFDYLKSSPSPRIRLTIQVYNTLLKSYVLIGAPFRVVSNLFSKLESTTLRPDAYTFALLIQSACDAGEMDVATDVFAEMEKLSKERGSDIHINVYVLTIIMAGYLRLGNKLRAKEIYDDMGRRGIQPTAISFGVILKAYGNEKSKASLEIAEKFIKSLMDVPGHFWNTPSYGRKSALDHVYGPVIDAYAKQQKVADVERLFNDMLTSGGEPSLGILTKLLNAYRNSASIDGVLQLWPQILELGLRYATSNPLRDCDKDDPTRERLQRNILCIPLSIYIDTLSAAGFHAEVAAAWKTMQHHGFTFDSHNWNHLVVALVRAGEVERAFDILEKVILPHQRESGRHFSPRDLEPATPLITPAGPPAHKHTPSEPPMHRSNHRAVVTQLASAMLPTSEELDANESNDFAHPLHILHQVPPTWNSWCPHAATLSILLLVLCRLRSGAIVQPVKKADASPQEFTSTQKLENQSRARETLERIRQNSPAAVRTIIDFEIFERRRLGGEYDQTYTWQG